MLRAVAICLAFSGMLAVPAIAQTPNVTTYCTAEGAFGQTFGARRVEREGRSMNGSGNRLAFNPRAAFPPFTEFEAGFTPTSRRLHSVQGEIILNSREAARATFEEIVAGLLNDPRFDSHEIAEPDVSASGAVWRTAKFYAGNAQPDGEQPSGFSVTLYFMERVTTESTIAMECVEAEIRRTAEREALADW